MTNGQSHASENFDAKQWSRAAMIVLHWQRCLQVHGESLYFGLRQEFSAL